MDAKRKGVDKMTMRDFNTEIAAYRREGRAKAESDVKARSMVRVVLVPTASESIDVTSWLRLTSSFLANVTSL